MVTINVKLALFVNYLTLDNHYGVYSLGFVKINIFMM